LADYSAQYVPALLKAMHNARFTVGTGVMGTERSRYLQILEMLTLFGMLLKIIQDIHPDVATDAAFTQRLNISLDTGPNGAKDWPGWVMLQIPPEDLPSYGATETDSPAVLQAKINAYNGSH
jgi:hypothetical protein